MNRIYLLAQLALVACASVAAVGAAPAGSGDLQKLCKGKPVELKTVGDFLAVAEALRQSGDAGCSEAAKGSILDLELIVAGANVCSVENARRIGMYYEKFVSKAGASYWKLPKSIKSFFLATGLEISRLCEESMIANLGAATLERITKEDDQTLRDFNNKADYLAERIMGRERQLQNLFIVTDMSGLISRGKDADELFGQETIAVNSKVKKLFDDVEKKCLDKFKPVYDQLMTPLVILRSIGFDNILAQGSPAGEARDKFYDEQVYRDWFKAAFICESTLRQKIVASKEVKNSVHILDERDLAMLRGEFGDDIDQPKALPPAVEIVDQYEVTVPLPSSTDFASDELQKQVKTFSKKRRAAKDSRKKLLKKFIWEAEHFIYIDQLKFGWINTEGITDYGARNSLTRKKEWIKKAFKWIFGAIGLVLVFPLALGFTATVGTFMVTVLGALSLLPSGDKSAAR